MGNGIQLYLLNPVRYIIALADFHSIIFTELESVERELITVCIPKNPL